MLTFYQNSSKILLEKLLTQKNQVVYAGFDATSDSLHIGNLALIMTLKKLQEECNHFIIAVIGGATTRIGDPTDKKSARKILSSSTIEQNSLGLKKSLSKFLKFAAPHEIKTDNENKCTNIENLYGKAILIDNYEWWKDVNYIQMITEYGRHFSINNMITIDTIKRRLQNQQTLSLLEFNYMVMQAYDFLYLYEKFNCTVQIGGSDQWGNIIQGIKLISKVHNTDALALTIPLITNSAGDKMGKTGEYTVWLNEEKLSPYHYYQYWININDNDIEKMKNTYTLLSEDTRVSRQELAYEITKLCHGKDNAEKAKKTTEELFNNNCIENAPEVTIQISSDIQELNICDLIFHSKLIKSKAEAKRLVIANGIKINRELCSLDTKIPTNKNILLSKGKKTHILCKFTKTK